MKTGRIARVQIARGEAMLNGKPLHTGDGAALAELGRLVLTGVRSEAEILHGRYWFKTVCRPVTMPSHDVNGTEEKPAAPRMRPECRKASRYLNDPIVS